jgi:hypothetical protein
MTHIILIDEYLYSRYKELLNIRVLADNHKGMNAAGQFLAQLAPHEVYYAKILYDKEQTAVEITHGNKTFTAVSLFLDSGKDITEDFN